MTIFGALSPHPKILFPAAGVGRGPPPHLQPQFRFSSHRNSESCAGAAAICNRDGSRIVGGARRERAMSHRSFQLIAVMAATVSVLMVAHIAEVVVWTFAYVIVGVAPAGTDLIYFAFLNYATLGYGDVTPLRRGVCTMCAPGDQGKSSGS
jgi:hypothetical protein